jgi:hypothetical protein
MADFWQNCPWKPEEIWAVYPYGSHVYGTAREDSDRDVVVIPREKIQSHDSFDFTDSAGVTWSYKTHDRETFQDAIDRHEVYALECLSLPREQIILSPPRPWTFKLNFQRLRESFSSKVSWDQVRAKKKFQVESDFTRGKKSLFHAIRILQFGIQVAESGGKVTDFQSANDYWMEIWTNPSRVWDDYDQVYRPIMNKLATDFKLVAPMNKGNHAQKKP